jgi:hypothetical protein
MFEQYAFQGRSIEIAAGRAGFSRIESDSNNEDNV